MFNPTFLDLMWQAESVDGRQSAVGGRGVFLRCAATRRPIYFRRTERRSLNDAPF
jgi:hypothetical protein